MTDQTPGACPAGHAGGVYVCGETWASGFFAQCKVCNWRGPSCGTSEAAIAAWNARSDASHLAAEKELLASEAQCERLRESLTAAEARAEEAERKLADTREQLEIAKLLKMPPTPAEIKAQGDYFHETMGTLLAENARLKGELEELQRAAAFHDASVRALLGDRDAALHLADTHPPSVESIWPCCVEARQRLRSAGLLSEPAKPQDGL